MRATIQGVQVELPLGALLKLAFLHYFRDPAKNLLRVMFPQAFRPEIPYHPANESEQAYFDSLHRDTRDPKNYYHSGKFHEKARAARCAPPRTYEEGPALGKGIPVRTESGDWARVPMPDELPELPGSAKFPPPDLVDELNRMYPGAESGMPPNFKPYRPEGEQS